MRILVFTAALLFAAPAAAQTAAQTAAQPLTVERVFADPSLAGPRPLSARFSPNGAAVTSLRPKTDDYLALDLVSEPVAGGGARVLIDARALDADDSSLSEAERARRERMRVSQHGVVEYHWDAQGRAILAPVGGDLFLADAQSGSVQRLTQTEADEIDPRFSPRGGYIGFVREQDLYVIDRAANVEQRLTADGGGVIANGLAEFIAQEELARHSGYWFSPDDARIAFTRTDESAVPVVQRPEINAEGVSVIEQRYPRAGAPNAHVALYIQPLVSGARVRADLGANEDIYLARVDWSADGRALYAQRLSRDQKTLDLLQINPQTGASRIVLTERARHWINVNDGFTPLGDGGFLWLSERDGFAHLYRYNAHGRMIARISRGAWPVRRVVSVDEARGFVYFLAGVETPIEQHLYRAPLQGGQPTRITQTPGWWDVEMNAASSAFIATYSDVATPPRVSLHHADGRFIRWIEENALDGDHPFTPYAPRYPATQFGAIPAPGAPNVLLHYRLDPPVGFDPRRRYPAIVDVYGGPGVQNVMRAWTSPRRRLYQEHGYVVFTLDNRGATNRGAAFEAALGGRFGDVETRDQLAGLAFLRSQPFIDGAHIGVTGWSYGGFMTLMLLTRHPDAFQAGVAGAPVANWRLYDTAYTERYLGLPDAPGDAYALSSPIGAAGNVRAPLLIQHGMADDNVTFDNSTQFIAALQQADVPFEMMAYPGQRHGLYARWASRHSMEMTLDFFDRALQRRS